MFMRKYLFLLVMLSGYYPSSFAQPLSQTKTATLLNHNLKGNISNNYFQREAREGAPIVLRGTIISPEGLIRHGYVAIVNGRIASVSDQQPDLPDAVTVNTHGIILPGFIDLHNHVRWNVLPRWHLGRTFTNQPQWADDPEVQRLGAPIDHLQSSSFCDMNAWGELRALVGGATSIMATEPVPCIHGLVRNLDFNSGFYGTTELDREHIFNVSGFRLPPPSDIAGRAAFVAAARFFIANPFYEALAMHVAEGTDAAAEEQFTFLQSARLLNPKGILIHGIPLGASDFQAMAAAGTALVWSPRSNLELYGATANISAALDAGVEIALAPDWALTGSSNMLDELKTAARWNREHLGGRLTDRQLVQMVTSAPARISGIDDQVGAINSGLRADILVINGDHNDPYHAVIAATVADVELVFIDGVPLYGDRMFMEHFWKRSDLEEINLPEAPKTLATPAATVLVADIETRLRLALEAEGTSLAPLTEPDVFVVSAAPVARVRSWPNITNRNIPTTIAQDLGGREEITYPGKLTVTVLPNPSWKYFTLRTQSSSSEVVQLRVMDVLGKIVEARDGIMANTNFHIGSNFPPGIYLVEVVQGTERQMLKVIRQ
jgi:5-methylthioadenosine/S-adenosylhomocysteine deaminase